MNCESLNFFHKIKSNVQLVELLVVCFIGEFPYFEMMQKYDLTKIGYYYIIDSISDINLIQLKVIYRKLFDYCIICYYKYLMIYLVIFKVLIFCFWIIIRCYLFIVNYLYVIINWIIKKKNSRNHFTYDSRLFRVSTN